MARDYKMYIDGQWVDALDGEVYEDLNPYTGEVFAKVASGKRADAKLAVDAAAAAFPAWSQTSPAATPRFVPEGCGYSRRVNGTRLQRSSQRRPEAASVSQCSNSILLPACFVRLRLRCTRQTAILFRQTSPVHYT